jgi:hypothetical protein
LENTPPPPGGAWEEKNGEIVREKEGKRKEKEERGEKRKWEVKGKVNAN